MVFIGSCFFVAAITRGLVLMMTVFDSSSVVASPSLSEEKVTIGMGDWIADWQENRTLEDPFEVDPYDHRVSMRGSGSIQIDKGIATFYHSPRLYINKSNTTSGWEDVEVTAYAKYRALGTSKSFSGFTMAARSNHDAFRVDACQALGYYARIYQDTGECSFQKEYYHNRSSGVTIYTDTLRVQCFPGGLPLQQWIGMKFRVTNEEEEDTSLGEAVLLELFLDKYNNGTWTLQHSYVDRPGQWMSSGSPALIPARCEHSNGDTVVGPRNIAMFRIDGTNRTTIVQWRDASVLDLTNRVEVNISMDDSDDINVNTTIDDDVVGAVWTDVDELDFGKNISDDLEEAFNSSFLEPDADILDVFDLDDDTETGFNTSIEEHSSDRRILSLLPSSSPSFSNESSLEAGEDADSTFHDLNADLPEDVMVGFNASSSEQSSYRPSISPSAFPPLDNLDLDSDVGFNTVNEPQSYPPSPSPSSGLPAPVRGFFKNSLLITVYLLLLQH